jgi:hypothetical protein
MEFTDIVSRRGYTIHKCTRCGELDKVELMGSLMQPKDDETVITYASGFRIGVPSGVKLIHGEIVYEQTAAKQIIKQPI